MLSSLEPNKTMGIDHISPKVLRYYASALYFPIYYLLSQCFTQSYLPYEWKIHHIIPIFKSGTVNCFQLSSYFIVMHNI